MPVKAYSLNAGATWTRQRRATDETVRDAVYPYIEMALQKEWEAEEQGME
jgi:hypothetical protein